MSKPALAYRIGASLYLNLTNRCTNRCVFCPKFRDLSLHGYQLGLEQEPLPGEVVAAVGAPVGIEEIVFCGFGEPLLRVNEVLAVAGILKERGFRIRVNTDGQANLVHGRNVLPELAQVVDCVSVSLNAADAETYDRLCQSPFGTAAFPAVCNFIREAACRIPSVVASAVSFPGVNPAECRDLAQSLGAQFRLREYQP